MLLYIADLAICQRLLEEILSSSVCRSLPKKMISLITFGSKDLHGPPVPAREWAGLRGVEKYYRAEPGQRVQDHESPKINATIYVYKSEIPTNVHLLYVY
uniref:Uncharacterized protein n=1 Tax=Romanomermis culicivorax TaxID=13658 RepID=A0A915HPD9_ROMCU